MMKGGRTGARPYLSTTTPLGSSRRGGGGARTRALSLTQAEKSGAPGNAHERAQDGPRWPTLVFPLARWALGALCCNPVAAPGGPRGGDANYTPKLGHGVLGRSVPECWNAMASLAGRNARPYSQIARPTSTTATPSTVLYHHVSPLLVTQRASVRRAEVMVSQRVLAMG